ncbi:hypothetical protein BKA69DRAFT_727978 [Paraphysoderma sedebokerense]|nr:hypothetical protein BKA69DRAFT_727978 [Paraphysoderma sedebokerense]
MLKKCFELKWCVGIAGGRPSSALYFHGYSNSRLLHLDPHYPQPTISLKSIPYFSTSPSSDDQNEEADEMFTLDDFKSYICSDIRSVNVADIDPSMVIGFYIPNAEEWDKFKTSWKEVCNSTV